jgi:uncharacterized protein
VPAQLTYPGVYIEEVPSGVRTITGVATSITAFVGRALRGPTDRPVTVRSFADFERELGGLWIESSLGYAVRDFFRLGGSTAVVVRAFRDSTAAADDVTRWRWGNANADLHLEARSPGAWGRSVTVRSEGSADTADPSDATLFNLFVADTATGRVEAFRNVSTNPASSQRVDTVLENRSRLVRIQDGFTLPTNTPAALAPAAVANTGTDGRQLDANTVVDAIDVLELADLVNLLVIPPYTKADNAPSVVVTETDTDLAVVTAAVTYAADHDAIALLDPPAAWTDSATAESGAAGQPVSENAALYFPRIRQPDPLRDNAIGTFAPSGAVAGIIARTDATRGVWKAPAGLDATLDGVVELSVPLTDGEIGALNPIGVNCLRRAPAAGHVIWGARTRRGNDQLASEWKYLPVRRTALFLKQSLFRGTQWVVFEPNDEPLWAQIRLNITAFMNNLFRQGAFAGTTPRDAFFVKCDAETTTPDDVNVGIVNIWVGFAPLKPAEFVVLHLQQMAGQAGGA